MTGNIKQYASLGLVHHMLYLNCVNDPAYHTDTLKKFAVRTDIVTFDFCVPYAEPWRSRAIGAVRNSGKDTAYALHLFPARKISLGSLDLTERELTKIVVRDQIEQAVKAGAKDFVFVSGTDYPDRRAEAQERFYEFCLWFCGELAPHGITALLEPFDRTVDKKFLYGSIDECVALVDRVKKTHQNIGIELDIAHLPIMGEDIWESVLKCGDRIKRVHLGNCVLKDKCCSLYGDMHPPMGIDGGEICERELTVALKALFEIGYLDKAKRNPLVLEMRPLNGEDSIECTITDSFDLLDKAWAAV
ncbi:MAG TPA: TIM barrel protein [Oscillospiraceae bacterium]|nr:TIM barrel protein [Oscillospiraceae bacterium]HPF55186.1 TIM barrel protein [Clostridiales bacterium]HPK36501.1 TIM barrel protein [Oscillospiraceae bacterium]HPR75734.1 TIM barrel protein [Oscillospiraceae bacterium]